MNSKFLKQFTKEEVEIAFNQMVPLKSSKPNGFGAVFYQKNWKIVGQDVSEAVLSNLNEEGITPSLNSTFIALIFKKCNDDYVCDFCSINLCNVVYKLISKVL